MYPVRLRFNAVTDRIEALMTNEHSAEALVTSVFTFEKLMKRSLRRAIVARGFSVAQADKLLDRDGFDALVSKWDIFERKHRTISSTGTRRRRPQNQAVALDPLENNIGAKQTYEGLSRQSGNPTPGGRRANTGALSESCVLRLIDQSPKRRWGDRKTSRFNTE